MNFGKCLFYGIVIAVLIIILIKLIKSVYENYENIEDKGIIDTIKEKLDDVKTSIIGDGEEKQIKENDENVLDEKPAPVNMIDVEGVSEDLSGLPKFVNKMSSNVIDGPKMIPQPTYTAWEDIYMNDNNDNSFMIDLGSKTNKDLGSGRFSNRSIACCSAQYPVPFDVHVSDEILKDKDNYVPSPYMGNNNMNNAGCTCMKKENARNLSVRGGNA